MTDHTQDTAPRLKLATLVPFLMLGFASAEARAAQFVDPSHICTLSRDVCVHGERTGESAAESAIRPMPTDLASAELTAAAISQARTRVRLAYGLSSESQWRHGQALQVHLRSDISHARLVTIGRDPLSAFDRAIVEVEFPSGLGAQALELEATRAVLYVARAQLSPGGNQQLERAEVETLASMLCQQSPEDPPPQKPRQPLERAEFWTWLDAKVSKQPGFFLRGAWSASASQTPSTSLDWLHDPDVLDVARTTLRTPGYGWSELGPAVIDFEADPARIGARGDRDWHLEWQGAARRVFAPYDMVPYAVSRISISKLPSRLRVEWEWEEHAHFTLMAVGLRADRSIERRIWVHSPSRGSNVSYTFGGLEQVAELVLLATNTGDPDRAYDPDEGPPEPHRFTLTYADADALAAGPNKP